MSVRVGRLVGWLVVMVALFVAALWVGAIRRQTTVPVLGVQGALPLHLEPIRFAAELGNVEDISLVFAEFPGGYPVLAATQKAPVWRKIREIPP